MLSRIRFGLEIRRRFTRTGIPRDVTVRKEDAAWLLREINSRGPVFIKIGQFISSRADLFEPILVETLQSLQDRVPAMRCVELDLVMHDAVDIASYEPDPIASASIGQVHRGHLTNGSIVAIKVRRPCIRENIESELNAVSTLLHIVSLVVGMSRDAELNRSITSTRRLIKDFREVMLSECDYMAEAKNMLLYQTFVKCHDLRRQWVSPRVFISLCSSDRIIMEYVPSVRIDVIVARLTREDRETLAVQLMDVYVSHLLVHNVAHADFQPGNIGIDSLGRIVIYDFGNIIRLPPALVHSLEEMLIPLLNQDADAMVEIMKRMGVIKVRDPVALRQYVDIFMEYIRSADFTSIDLSVIDQEALRSNKLPVEIDGVMFRLLRGFMLVEGLCKSIDDRFSYSTIIYKYAMKLTKKDDRVLWGKIRADVKSLLSAAVRLVDV